jgi:exonuclease III
MSEQLSMLSWNVRGLNSPARREATRPMILTARPWIVCLQEMKLSAISQQDAVQILGPHIDSFQFLPALGTRGGIMMGWQSDRVQGLFIGSANHSRWFNSTFLLTTVYGPVGDDEKQDFLTEPVQIRPMPPAPWILLGDFNLIYEDWDKNNSNLNWQLMGRYTWSNERQSPTLVKLDMVFCNKEWELAHTDFTLQALSSSLPDHCPIYLCQQITPRGRKFSGLKIFGQGSQAFWR